jgi:hypothetical protein
MAGAVCIGGAPATLANAFVRPRVNDGERQRPLERLANGLLSWLSLLPATLFSAKAAAAGKNLMDTYVSSLRTAANLWGQAAARTGQVAINIANAVDWQDAE